MPIKTIIAGVTGRMGKTLAQMVLDDDRFSLIGGTEHKEHAELGSDLGSVLGVKNLGLSLTAELEPLFAQADAVIDFTIPSASLEHAKLAAQSRITHIIGTTGFTAEQEEDIIRAAHHAVVVKSGNMSLGVNLLAALVEKTARMLDEDFDIEVLEMHHRHKIDAPSGTALMLANAAAHGRNKGPQDEWRDPPRDGITGARQRGKIGMAALRGGSVVGDHEVLFASDEEIITLAHRAQNRSLFARGALRAALWGQGKKPGLYNMRDVLELNG